MLSNTHRAALVLSDIVTSRYCLLCMCGPIRRTPSSPLQQTWAFVIKET